MVQYVTLAQASMHLRRDSDDDDTDVLLKISAASGAVKNYLKSGSPYEQEETSNGDLVPVLDSAGEPIVLPEVQQATLLLLGYFYRDRDGQDPNSWNPGYLPEAVKALLYPLRDPALA